ncbi:hypothetical protein DOT_3857, partial [Desulfosporosinus sp. OT]
YNAHLLLTNINDNQILRSELLGSILDEVINNAYCLSYSNNFHMRKGGQIGKNL